MDQARVVTALNDKPLYMRAYAEIKSAIISGRVRPGQRLKQAGLAEQLQVSRAPVLDALARLATEGLVEHDPRNGYFVRVLGVKDIANLYNVRRALECQALEEVYGRLGSEGIAKLGEILQEAYDDLQQGNVTTYLVADQRFHSRLVELADNNVLLDIFKQLMDQIQLIRVMVAVSPQRVMRAAKEHEEIMMCLDRQDLAGAKKALLHHIDSVKVEVISQHQKR